MLIVYHDLEEFKNQLPENAKVLVEDNIQMIEELDLC